MLLSKSILASSEMLNLTNIWEDDQSNRYKRKAVTVISRIISSRWSKW